MGRRALGQAGLTRAEIRCLEQRPVPPPRWSGWLGSADHHLFLAGSPGYPVRLAEIPDAPLALWVDGREPELLHHAQLAIVGSRHPTTNGRLDAENFAAALSGAGLTITSGLAHGIDAASHEGALGRPGSTIAVLGNGIDRIYPAGNEKLAARIRASGVILSEYPPGHGVRAAQFPQRNRIIAGLAIGTLVVEATRRSGSLITARLAAEYGREVFAVPGSIHNALSKGCHKLIADGARLVEEARDILVEIAPQLALGPAPEGMGELASDNASLPDVLENCLDFAPIGFDSLISATGLTAAELSSILLHLELQGKIEALPGGRYCRLAKRA